MIENDLRFGPVWVFDKPAGAARCEAHGIAPNKTDYDFSDNATYYISWWDKVSSTANNDTEFQWRPSGGDPAQDSAFVISTRGGHATVSRHQTIWTSPGALSANTWHHYVLGVHTSATASGGWIELWYDGKQQTFGNGSERYAGQTWDGGDDPKWGEFGPQTGAATDYVSAPRVGTSYGSVVS